jgi:hypothetical protein
VLRHPARSLAAMARLVVQPKLWLLGAWVAGNAIAELARLPLRLLPAAAFARYRTLPAPLRGYARYAERKLRMLRFSYLGLSLFYQLELTRAQIPLQRFGKCIEHLVSMLAVCHHAALGDETTRDVAALQAQLLQDKYRALRLFSGLPSLQRTRRAVARIGQSLEEGRCSLIEDIEPQRFGHPWDESSRDERAARSRTTVTDQ